MNKVLAAYSYLLSVMINNMAKSNLGGLIWFIILGHNPSLRKPGQELKQEMKQKQ